MSESNSSAYSPEQIENLEEKANQDNSEVKFNGSGDSNVVQPCSKSEPKKNEAEDCTFQGILISKAGRQFNYQFTTTDGIAEGKNTRSAIYEVIAGTKVPAKIKIQKQGLIGPCSEKGHEKHSWDIEGYESLDDSNAEIEVFPGKNSEAHSIKSWIPQDFKPRPFTVCANTCGANHKLLVKCYPDTVFSLNGRFTVFESKTSSSKKTKSRNQELKSNNSSLELEVQRSGEVAFKIDLFEYENKKTHSQKFFTTSGQDEGNIAAKKFSKLVEFKNYMNKLKNIEDELLGPLLDGAKEKGLNTSFTWESKLLNFKGGVTANWAEVPNSRYCDYRYKINFEINPILSLSLDWDITCVLYSVPYLGLALKLTKQFLSAFENNDFGIKFQVDGDISLALSEKSFWTKGFVEKESFSHNLEPSGQISIALYTYCKFSLDFPDTHSFSAGASGEGEFGLKAMISDTETLYQQLKDPLEQLVAEEKSKGWLESLRSRYHQHLLHKFNHLETEEDRICKLLINGSRVSIDTKIGFSGLMIYSMTQHEGGIKKKIEKGTLPENKSFADGLFDKTESIVEKDIGSKKKSDSEKIHQVIGMNPLIWEEEIVLTH